MIEADDVRVCGIHPLVAEEYEMHGITTMDSDWWSTRTQRDFDAMYEQQAQCAAEPTAEMSGLWATLSEDQQQRILEYRGPDTQGAAPMFRAATEDDYFAEFERMRATIAELSRRPTMEQYLAVCESGARITKAFEMAMDTWHQLQAEYDALSGRVLERKASGFPANALRHSV